VKKIAAMAANLDPQGVYPEIWDWARKEMDSMLSEAKQTPDGKRELKLLQMSLTEPHIDPKSLETITVPTLVLAGDHDMIRDEHTLDIYHHLPNAELCIFPGATHAVPYDDPVVVQHDSGSLFSETICQEGSLWRKPNKQPISQSRSR
jgi:pimeloyl-ACP methyl ester carboxylesterase